MLEEEVLIAYNEDTIKEIEKDFEEIGLSEWIEEYNKILENESDVWKAIYIVMKQKLVPNRRGEVSKTFVDIIVALGNDFKRDFFEALCYLKYSLRRAEKEHYIIHFLEDDTKDLEDLESIKEDIFKEQIYKNIHRDGTQYDFEEDLFPTINRVVKRCKHFNPDIKFEWEITEDKKLKLEDSYWVLQLMLLINDRFRSVFSRTEGDGNSEKLNIIESKFDFDKLSNIRAALKRAEKKVGYEDTDIYVWEKLTHMNMAVLLTQYYFEIEKVFEDYELVKGNSPYNIEEYNNSLYTKNEFQTDMEELAQNLGRAKWVLSALVLVRKVFEYILCDRNINLYKAIKTVKYVMKDFFDDDIDFGKGEKRDKIVCYAQIILYLRDKAEGKKEHSKKRQRVMLELDEICYKDFMEMLYYEFDEQKWYENILDSLVEYGENSFSNELCYSKTIEELSFENIIPEDIKKINAYFQVSYENIYGRLACDAIREGYICSLQNKNAQKILKGHEECWKKEMICRIKKIIQTKEWESIHSLAKVMAEQEWCTREMLFELLENEQWEVSKAEACNAIEHSYRT